MSASGPFAFWLRGAVWHDTAYLCFCCVHFSTHALTFEVKDRGTVVFDLFRCSPAGGGLAAPKPLPALHGKRQFRCVLLPVRR